MQSSQNILNENKSEIKFLQNIKKGSFEDKAYGCILGSFIGDACGSYVEFSQSKIDKKTMEECMKMPGGGPFSLAPGQITDDGELAMCLMAGIVDSNQKLNEGELSCLNLSKISNYYSLWIKSPPFDIGMATSSALDVLQEQPENFSLAYKNAEKFNQNSRSNGSLMRCTPIAVWASNLESESEFYQAIEADVRFTHPNKLVIDSVYLYCTAIKYLLNNSDDSKRAQKAFQHAYKESQDGGLASHIEQNDGERALNWLQYSLKMEEFKQDNKMSSQDFLKNYYDAIQSMGYLKHAMILSFYFLLQAQHEKSFEQFFEKCLYETNMLGGDTDTNGAIVGGLIGALVGAHQIPEKMLEKILNFDNNGNLGIKRPDFLSVKLKSLNLIESLIKCRPKKLIIQDQSKM